VDKLKDFAVVVESWFDGEGHHQETATFVIKAGAVADIADGDLGRDLSARGLPVAHGGFLMPGLVDAHVHLFLDGKPTDGPTRSAHLKKPLEELTEAARQSARQSLACGITLVRDAGDRHGINHRVRDEAAAAHGLARVRSGGPSVTALSWPWTSRTPTASATRSPGSPPTTTRSS
jgi:imidazolonepropionase-like amidohydrolase